LVGILAYECAVEIYACRARGHVPLVHYVVPLLVSKSAVTEEADISAASQVRYVSEIAVLKQVDPVIPIFDEQVISFDSDVVKRAANYAIA
jgi:hypothetical protein